MWWDKGDTNYRPPKPIERSKEMCPDCNESRYYYDGVCLACGRGSSLRKALKQIDWESLDELSMVLHELEIAGADFTTMRVDKLWEELTNEIELRKEDI